jgi:hypothetical protein
MNPSSPLPIRPSPTVDATLPSPATTTHEFASSDASASRYPFRDAQRDIPAGRSSC